VADSKEGFDEFALEEIGRLHAIAADVFVPFAIHRLGGTKDRRSCDLAVDLLDIAGATSETRTLRMTWQPESVLERPPGVQENVITEWAALGLAAAVAWRFAGLRIQTVADAGDRFDYWVTDGDRLAGLEVSGTTVSDLAALRVEKARQLLANPHRVDGYVVVVRFDLATASISFHRFSEAER
jgi:hypothetical protein